MTLYRNMNRKSKYHGVAEDIARRIRSGEITQRLPTLESLSKEYNLTLVTMQKALHLLKAQGHIRAFPGQGIFVSPLKRTPSNNIALITNMSPDHCPLGNERMPITSRLVNGIRQEGLAHGLKTFVEEHNWKPKVQLEKIREIVEECRADGIVLWQAENSERSKSVDYLREKKFPFVLVPDPDLSIYHDCHTVTSMDSGGAAELMTHLLSSGHRNIAFVAHKIYVDKLHYKERYGQYLRSMELAGHTPIKPVILTVKNHFSEIKAMISGRDGKIDSVFCESHYAANLLISTFLKMGIKVPGDIAVASYDDTEFARIIGLTVVEQYFDRIGSRAVEILVDELAGKLSKPIHSEIKSELIIRGSTKAGKGKRRQGNEKTSNYAV